MQDADLEFDEQDFGGEGTKGNFFDMWRVPRGARLAPLCAEVGAALDTCNGPRQRKRKPQAQQVHDAIVATIVGNLAFAVVMAFNPPTLAIRAAHRAGSPSRYDRKGMSNLPARLKDLEASGLVKFETSRRRRWLSTVQPTEMFGAKVREAGATLADIGRVQDAETIVVTRAQSGFNESSSATGVTTSRYGRIASKRIEYKDTAESLRYRAEMVAINAALEGADLAYVGPEPVETDRRGLHRVFNDIGEPDCFAQGGRLYGGWWQNLARNLRCHIRIDGEPIADLDFKSMFVRLAYLSVRATPPDGDLYAGIRHLDGPRQRDAVKKLISALMFSKSKRQRIPREIPKDLIPPGVRFKDLMDAILEKHPLLAPVLDTPAGYALSKTESTILIDILSTLAAEGTTALPMHDGIMVAASKADRATAVMGDAAERITGFRLPVERKA
ncbi:hypothetical protein C2U72_24635 [Prosthecomicrobium hirschii]|uniref:hypothetical protein n=1 Tax=Prosthecodimorpha hirschii TaxID=665126 RepID=UPI0011283A41|nr:hypothetical protein [Prosthecomicrobium hirschii]TPQ47245.1 hypothetical protein C2U72_24635 [Prosthecomicrobium hirschii]